MNNGCDISHPSILLLSIIIVCSIHFTIPPTLLAAPYYGVYVPDNYATIQAAIDASCDGWTTIIVREGTYGENINFLGKAITVKSTDPNNPEVIANTIIDGNQVGSVVTFTNGEGPNCVLKGMTISNGSFYNGGGIYCYESSPTITNCIISGNTSEYSGGGIYCRENSLPSINNCTISGNTANGYGGGILCSYYSSPNISNCAITRNKADDDGSGIFCSYSSPSINNCTISGNTANGYGGGIVCSYYSSPNISNCAITRNKAGDNGSGIFCSYSSPSINNCTISGNTANGYGGGIYCYSSLLKITNCILWSNIPNEICGSTAIVTYSDIQGGYGDPNITHNIDINPLFLDPNAGDYRLWYASPCIDAGDPNAPNLPLTDKESRSRIINSKPDMGAYEYLELLTLSSGFNLVSFPEGLEWSWLRNQNMPLAKIQVFQPEAFGWLTLLPVDEINFSFSSGKSWLVYISQKSPDPIELTIPNPFSALVFNPQEDLFHGMNLLNGYSLYEMLTINYSQQLLWPKNVFQKLNQETGKDSTCIARYDHHKGRWQAEYPFFGQVAGRKSRIKKEDYIVYFQ